MLQRAKSKAHGTLFVGIVLFSIVGCRSARISAPSTAPSSQLTERIFVDTLEAECAPPTGWIIEKSEVTGNHAKQVWVSHTGQTAYGVIRFSLPFPVGHDLALWGFLQEMKRSEGVAILLEKQWDPQMQGLRFVAEGGRYLVRTNLFVRGFHGWAVFAGTKRDHAIDFEELKQAEEAREHTSLGSPVNSK